MSWQVGVSTCCSLNQPILTMMEEVERAGIAGVEVSTPPHHFDPGQFHQVTAVLDRMRAHGITPVSIHAPFGGPLDLSDPNPHHRHAAIGAIWLAACALKELGGRIVVVHTTDAVREHGNMGRRLDDCAASLSILARGLKSMDLTLAIESPLPHLIGGDAGEFAYILKNVHGDAGVCLDTSHTTLGHQWRRFVEVAGHRVIHLHANDHDGHSDGHLAPGDGIIDWREIGDSLRRLEYRGWIILELNCPSGSPRDHFVRARRQLEERIGLAP